MRLSDPALRPGERVAFTFDGMQVDAHAGESLAAALAAAGVMTLGRRRDGTARGLYCGMGVCQECVVTVDGRAGMRACMTPVADAMTVTSQAHAVTPQPASPRTTPREPLRHRPEVLVVGAGPAGLSAARAAALCGVGVTIVDERAAAGGQYFKQIARSHAVVDAEGIDGQFRAGRALIDDVARLGVQLWRDASVWGAFGIDEIAVTAGGEQHLFAPQRLVVASGVYERGVPVPGWTLPGFLTSGAAQTLMRAYRVAPGRRVLVAGNGPLNFQIAADLVAAGIDVVAVVEAAPRPGIGDAADVWRSLLASPRLIADGVRYIAKLNRAGVRIVYSSAVVAASGDERVQTCTIARLDGAGNAVPDSERCFAVDTVCASYGFLPSNEIPRALGCRHEARAATRTLGTVTDADGLTSVAGVYVVGDVVDFAGAHAARCQGFITGCAIARSLGRTLPPVVSDELAVAQRQLRRHRAFQAALWRLFAAPLLTTQLAAPDTLVCRCEAVTRAQIEAAIAAGDASPGAVKRRTRACMGRCQGRYCETLVAAMIPDDPAAPRDERFHLAPRAPIKPVRIGDLV